MGGHYKLVLLVFEVIVNYIEKNLEVRIDIFKTIIEIVTNVK